MPLDNGEKRGTADEARHSLHELHSPRRREAAPSGARRHRGGGRRGGDRPGPPGGREAPLQELGDTGGGADEAGIVRFTAMDHWFQMEHFQTAFEPMLEGYSVLNFVAAKTERVQLGLLVTGVTYRHPGLLAKTVTTLDVLSGGRAFLGIGAAWYEREHRALGVDYPPVSERFERLEETIQICEQMWSDDDGPYEGKHYQL